MAIATTRFKSVHYVLAGAVVVAIAAGFSVFLLGHWAKQSADMELDLVRLRGELRALGSLEWQAIAKADVDARTEQKVAGLTALIDQIRGDVGDATPGKDIDALNSIYLDYSKAMKREFELIKAGEIGQAREFDESTVDPLFDKLNDRIEDMTSGKASARRRVEILADVGMLASVLIAALAIAYSFSSFTHDQVRQTRKLNDTLVELRQAQDHLVQSERLAALGQLVAGIAHEVNTPLGAIRAAAGNGKKALARILEQLPQLAQRLTAQEQALFFSIVRASLGNTELVTSGERRPVVRALAKKLEEAGIPDTRSLAELLLDIGMRSGIEAALPLLKHPHRDWLFALAYDLRRLHGNNETMSAAVERAAKVLFAFRNYARIQDSGDKIAVNLHDNVQMVLDLYRHQIRRGIDVEVQMQDLPLVAGHPDELVQVWTNLIHNAVQAMEGKGKLKLAAEQRDGHVVVSITDSGPGVPPDVQHRIFEPFFTTKTMGEGSGLGLHICREIIAKHNGAIKVVSEPGSTTFSVWLPACVPSAAPAARTP